MPGHQYTQSEYTLQNIVEAFSNVLLSFELQRLTHTNRVAFGFAKWEGIDYVILQYLLTGMLPVEEFSEEWWFDGEI
jgi:hypothetical protein